MKKYILFLGFLTALNTQVNAQKVVLAQDVAKDSAERKFGPNLKYYGHFFAGYGFMAGPAENNGSRITYLNSHEWQFGYRFKYKVGNVYSLGFDLAINPQTYYLKQKPEKTLPTPDLYDEEKLKLTNIGLSFYNRFNYDKRGNYIGNFIDLGVYGNWLAVSKHLYEFDPDADLTGAKSVLVKESDLTYFKDFNYGALVRVGFNRYVFYGNYRISDLFNTSFQHFAELPRYTIGFELGLHK